MTKTVHQELILDQFTRQAAVFSTAPAITDEDALGLIIAAARPDPHDRLLDVACGPASSSAPLRPTFGRRSGSI